MATKLKDLEIDEISLVDKAANPSAMVMLYKRQDVSKALSGSYEDSIDQIYAAWRKANGDSYMYIIASFSDKVVVRMDEGTFIIPYEKSESGIVFKDPVPAMETVIAKAKWTTAFINDLPDSSFAFIETGGKKVDGKTTPRSLRHLPYKDANGKVDLPHTRNALARLDQVESMSQAQKDRVRAQLQAALENANKSAAATPPEEDTMDKDIQKLQAELDAAKAELEAKNKEFDAIKVEKDSLSKRVDEFENSPEQIEKRKTDAMPEEIRKKYEDAIERVKKLEESAEVKEFTEKAKDVGQPETFGPIYRRIYKGQATKEDLEELDKILKAQHEQNKEEKLFKAYGRDGNDGDVADDASREIITKAHQLMKEDPKLEFADAQERVVRENPALYDRYRKESYDS